MAQTEQQRIQGELAEAVPEFYDDILKVVIQYLGHAWPSDWMRWMKHQTCLIRNGSRTVQAPDSQWNVVIGDPPAFVGSYGFRIAIHGLGSHLNVGVALIAPQFNSLSPLSLQGSLATNNPPSEFDDEDDDEEDNNEHSGTLSLGNRSKSGQSNRGSSRLLGNQRVETSYEMVLYSLVPGYIYYPCKINRNIFREQHYEKEGSLNSQNSQSRHSSEISQLDPFFLDDSIENNTNSTSSTSIFSSRSSSFHPTTRSSQATSLTKLRLVPSLPSLTKKKNFNTSNICI